MEHFAIATQVSVCFQVLQADEAATEDAVRSHVVWRIALNKMEKWFCRSKRAIFYWCNFALGADSAIQPGIVIYFVVMFTVGKERVLLYTIARILDTGFGVLLTLLLYVLYPSKYDKAKGVSLKTFWAEINNAFQSYKIKNRTMRKKEHENFGTDDDKNFSFIVSKIKKDKHL